jgi:hypothetical protein
MQSRCEIRGSSGSLCTSIQSPLHISKLFCSDFVMPRCGDLSCAAWWRQKRTLRRNEVVCFDRRVSGVWATAKGLRLTGGAGSWAYLGADETGGWGGVGGTGCDGASFVQGAWAVGSAVGQNQSRLVNFTRRMASACTPLACVYRKVPEKSHYSA